MVFNYDCPWDSVCAWCLKWKWNPEHTLHESFVMTCSQTYKMTFMPTQMTWISLYIHAVWSVFAGHSNVSCLMTKPTKWHVHPAKTQISLGILPVWSEPLHTWRNLGSLATHWAQSENSDQTGWMLRLIWVFAGKQSLCWFCHELAHVVTDPKLFHANNNDWSDWPYAPYRLNWIFDGLPSLQVNL